jgi:hypothetical protein
LFALFGRILQRGRAFGVASFQFGDGLLCTLFGLRQEGGVDFSDAFCMLLFSFVRFVARMLDYALSFCIGTSNDFLGPGFCIEQAFERFVHHIVLPDDSR